MTWVAVAIGGSALLGAGTSYLGGKQQARGAQRGQDINLHQFDVINAQEQPFVQSGYGAMGKLNTLLGLSPRPAAPGGAPGGVPMPQRPGFVPTPGGGVRPDMRLAMGAGDPNADPWAAAAGAGQPPADNVSLRHILALRAQHGDTQAARMLGLV